MFIEKLKINLLKLKMHLLKITLLNHLILLLIGRQY